MPETLEEKVARLEKQATDLTNDNSGLMRKYQQLLKQNKASETGTNRFSETTLRELKEAGMDVTSLDVAQAPSSDGSVVQQMTDLMTSFKTDVDSQISGLKDLVTEQVQGVRSQTVDQFVNSLPGWSEHEEAFNSHLDQHLYPGGDVTNRSAWDTLKGDNKQDGLSEYWKAFVATQGDNTGGTQNPQRREEPAGDRTGSGAQQGDYDFKESDAERINKDFLAGKYGNPQSEKALEKMEKLMEPIDTARANDRVLYDLGDS